MQRVADGAVVGDVVLFPQSFQGWYGGIFEPFRHHGPVREKQRLRFGFLPGVGRHEGAQREQGQHDSFHCLVY